MSRQTRHIPAIDRGTTGSTALVMSTDGETLGRSNRVVSVQGALEVAGVRGTDIAPTRAHLARATLEGIAHQVDDLVRALRDCPHPLRRMRVDGGAAANDVLVQFQSDVSDLVVERPVELESTARGAAMLAGIGVGLFANGSEASQMTKIQKKFEPTMDAALRRLRLAAWNDAVRRTVRHGKT